MHKLQVKGFLDEILERLPEEFNIPELAAKVEEKTPYVLVALQECERMNNLTRELRRSLKELDLGMKVCLQWSFLKKILRVLGVYSSWQLFIMSHLTLCFEFELPICITDVRQCWSL